MSDTSTTPVQDSMQATAPALSGVRAGAFAVYRVLIVVFALAILVQVFLAGLGIFGMDGSVTNDEGTTELDPHRAVGHILTQPVMLVILIAAAIARPGRRILSLTAVLLVVGIVQTVLGIAGGDTPLLGGLHALNALIYLALTGYLVRLANPGLGRRTP